MKRCNLCGCDKPLSDFARHKHYKDGHRSQCKDCIAAKPKTPEQRAKAVEHTQAYRARNREKVQQYEDKYHTEHRAARNQKNRRWRAANPDKHRKLVADWSKRNPLANAVYVARRRARLAGGAGSHTVAEWKERLRYFNHCCAYCLLPEPVVGRLTKDHMAPLALGGSDDIDNIVPACQPCNSRKGPRPLFVFIPLLYGEKKCL